MVAWRASPRPPERPISFSIAALSTAPVSDAAGKSTTRTTEPRSGGATPIPRSAASAVPELSAGGPSVTQRSVEVRPVAFLTFAFGAVPSMSTIALPDVSWPVTTRRVGRAIRSDGERTEAEVGAGGGRPFRDAPVVVAVRRPRPVIGLADLVRRADALHFPGVLDRGAERSGEIGEHVVARAVPPRPPEGLEPRVLEAPDAAHHRVDVDHLEGDVVEERIVAFRVGDRVVHPVATHEAHEAGAVGQPEAEHVDRETR